MGEKYREAMDILETMLPACIVPTFRISARNIARVLLQEADLLKAAG